jgi:hypothetical protein
MVAKYFATIPLLILALILLLLEGCDDSGVNPILNKSPLEFTWTVDTLHIEGNFQTLMTSIWGNSSKNIYVVGHTDGVKGTMWRYNGTRWTDVKLHAIYGGPIIGAFELSTIYGFSADNIWCVGSYVYDNPSPPPTFIHPSLIIHFNGSKWEVISSPKGDLLTRLWGNASDDIWTGGMENTLFHYDGTFWIKDSMGISDPENGGFQITGIHGTSSNTFATGVTLIDNVLNETYYFFMRNNNRWAAVDSFIINTTSTEYKFGARLWVPNEGSVFSYGSGGIFKWTGSDWQKYFGESPIACIDGTGTEYMIAVGGFGKAYYRNGYEWKQIKAVENPNILFRGVWADGKELFIIGITTDGYPQKTVVYHGK